MIRGNAFDDCSQVAVFQREPIGYGFGSRLVGQAGQIEVFYQKLRCGIARKNAAGAIRAFHGGFQSDN